MISFHARGLQSTVSRKNGLQATIRLLHFYIDAFFVDGHTDGQFRALLDNNPQVGLRVMSVAANAYFSRYVETLKKIQNVVNDIGGF